MWKGGKTCAEECLEEPVRDLVSSAYAAMCLKLAFGERQVKGRRKNRVENRVKKLTEGMHSPNFNNNDNNNNHMSNTIQLRATLQTLIRPQDIPLKYNK